MIQAKELRIGNWVETKYGIRKISSLDTANCSTLIDKCKISQKHFSYNEINPILISEEILLKCGLENVGDEWFINGKCFQLFDNGFSYSAGLFYKLSIPIHYLHQLQNLYFALTGQELTKDL